MINTSTKEKSETKLVVAIAHEKNFRFSIIKIYWLVSINLSNIYQCYLFLITVNIEIASYFYNSTSFVCFLYKIIIYTQREVEPKIYTIECLDRYVLKQSKENTKILKNDNPEVPLNWSNDAELKKYSLRKSPLTRR